MKTTCKSIESIATRIDMQQKKLAQLKAQRARMESTQKSRESKMQRAADTRRKILIGAVFLNAVAANKIDNKFVRDMLDAALERDDDRALFSLPPRPSSATVESTAIQIN